LKVGFPVGFADGFAVGFAVGLLLGVAVGFEVTFAGGVALAVGFEVCGFVGSVMLKSGNNINPSVSPQFPTLNLLTPLLPP
jgi:hypothetical protein